MEDQLITFETAKLAKEKGFDISTNGFYNEDLSLENEIVINNTLGKFNNKTSGNNNNKVSAPTQSLLQKWFREKHNIFIEIIVDFYKDGINYLQQVLEYEPSNETCHGRTSMLVGDNGEYKTYEEALEKGLQEALKLI